MLTGESIPSIKTAVPVNGDYVENFSVENGIQMKHFLFSGTEVIQNKDKNSDCMAIVVKTGFLSAKGELIRSILYPTPNRFKFDLEIRYFLTGMMVLALIMWGAALPTFIKYFSVGDIFLETFDIFSLPVPPELPVAMSVGIIFALKKLKNKGIS